MSRGICVAEGRCGRVGTDIVTTNGGLRMLCSLKSYNNFRWAFGDVAAIKVPCCKRDEKGSGSGSE